MDRSTLRRCLRPRSRGGTPRFRRTGSPRSHQLSAMLTSVRRLVPRLSGPFYLATGLWLFVLALVILGTAAIYLPDWSHARSDFRPNASDVVSVFPILAFATVGALIAWSQPRNRIGWLLIATAIAATFLALPKFYAGLRSISAGDGYRRRNGFTGSANSVGSLSLNSSLSSCPSTTRMEICLDGGGALS